MKPINEQINPKIVKQVQLLSKYTALLRNILPPECLNHVEVANIRNQNLMLITDSPVWTTKLRQLSPQILQGLQKNSISVDSSSTSEIAKIHHVQISTRYKHSHHTNGSADRLSGTQSKPLLKISEKTAEMLSQSANSIEHPQLKDALLKMARNTSKKQNK